MNSQENYYTEMTKELKANRFTRRAKNTVFALLAGVVGFSIYSMNEKEIKPSDKIVPIVKIGGEIGASTNLHRLTLNLEKAFMMPSNTVILSVDSPGGDPTLAQRINARLKFLRAKHPDKKVISICEKLCASAGYMIAIQADEVLAGPYSLVGSIGAIISTMNYSGLLERVGVKHKTYSSGEYKSMLNPFLPSNEHDELKAREIVKTMGQSFEAEVRSKRKIDPKAVIDNGEIWTAQQAKELGLIDRIGVIEDVAFGDLDGAIPYVIDQKKDSLSSMVGSFLNEVVVSFGTGTIKY